MNLSLLVKNWKSLNNYLRNLVKDTLKVAIISSKNNQNISKMHNIRFCTIINGCSNFLNVLWINHTNHTNKQTYVISIEKRIL